MRLTSIIIVLAVLVFLLSGCAKTLYDWGSYQPSIYRMYADKEFSPNHEIEVLSREIHETEKKKKKVPPGKHAHLGYLYYKVGDTRSAIHHLEAEAAAFPESRPFMNVLLEQIR